LPVILGFGLGAFGCEPSPQEMPPLRADEKVLVDAYVRISVLENCRGEAVPESVHAAFDRVARDLDSTAVRRALDGLAREPRRWEPVFDAIVQEFQRLENSPTPPSLRDPRPGVPQPRASR
jgi:hypothetical protein